MTAQMIVHLQQENDTQKALGETMTHPLIQLHINLYI